ncbi:DUF899 family protein [Sphingomonas jatrophae]|uniref:Predicted dithiol-disulfide oxidoreductase, DUF899 family n=1 Tax=Sphingomonas jatrophae TaxID=1166337 RepID=A0A1I6LMW8_9SPHN|nr:DUF899 family protein [Sphingomonas jatrophae]SFS04795.1 Predicted dithiol-disulfide oxidoreductase, DUF899 family [Sphingomonas jatrophae]
MSDALEPVEPMAARTPVRWPGESEAYRAARTALLAEEYRLRRTREAVAAQRRALPPGPVFEDRYRFEGPGGETNLAGLFGDHDTLVVYVMMFAPQGGRTRPCPMCTSTIAAWDQSIPSMRRNFAPAVVARRTSAADMQAFAAERGWRNLPLFADLDGRFVADLQAVGPDDMDNPGLAVFTRAGGTIRLFWADEMALPDPGQDPRGQADFQPLWTLLDLTPEGRRPDWYPTLDD